MRPDVEDVRQPPKALVARLAAALAAPRRGVRITDPDRAWAYFEAQATRQLSLLRDPRHRLSLVETEEARSACRQKQVATGPGWTRRTETRCPI
jgi:hypothetical protein